VAKWLGRKRRLKHGYLILDRSEIREGEGDNKGKKKRDSNIYHQHLP